MSQAATASPCETSTSSATDRVFAITELVDGILAELPPLDAITCRRVCHKFDAVVEALKPSPYGRLYVPLDFTFSESREEHQASLAPPEVNTMIGLAIEKLSGSNPSAAWAEPKASWRRMHASTLPVINSLLQVTVSSYVYLWCDDAGPPRRDDDTVRTYKIESEWTEDIVDRCLFREGCLRGVTAYARVGDVGFRGHV